MQTSAKGLFAVALALLPVAAVAGPSFAHPGATTGAEYRLVADARDAERRKRDARLEEYRREQTLNRLEAQHNEWQRRLRVLRQENPYRPLDLDVPVYDPRRSEPRR